MDKLNNNNNMKRTFLSLLALITMGGSMTAGDKPVITVADVEALPGETVSFAVNLVDGKADTYTAMTLYAYFPTEGFTTTETYTVASAWVGATGVVGDIDTTTGLATIPFASANAITGSEVNNLVTVSFTVDNSVAIGEYPITLKGTMFEYNESDKDYADDVTFNVKVVDKHSVVLDETSTVAPVAATGVDVRVKRTINANEWSTICLPFDMSEAQVKAAFGDDVQLAYFTGYDVEKDGTDVTSITINFDDDDLSEGFDANYPYLIKTSKDITEFSLTTDITPDDVQDSYSSGHGANKKSGKFIGTYQANTVVPKNSLFLSGNQFWYSTGLTNMKAFRAYFTISDVLTNMENADSRIQLSFNEEATGIKTIERKTMDDERYYNLKGQRVEMPHNGIYVKNGKKIVVK